MNQQQSFDSASNELLREKFKELQVKLVGSVDGNDLLDFLFGEKVITSDQLYQLRIINDRKGRKEQTRELLMLLHNSEHPKAFVHLRNAIAECGENDWIIDKLNILIAADSVVEPAVAVIPNTTRPQLTASLEMASRVMGVALLANKIYAVCCGSDTIHVIGRFPRYIQVEGLKDPHDIVVCRETSQIYIADCASIWRIKNLQASAVTEVEKLIWSKHPRSLSLTSRRLLVTSQSCIKNELLVYGDDGKELMQVSLPVYMEAQHAVETSNGTFLVCHTGKLSHNVSRRGHLASDPQQRSKHGVSEVDSNGNVIRVCREPLQWPRHLALDEEGRVFVADCGNQRVLLLNEELQVERVLLDKENEEMNDPRRLCYAPETGYLVVGEWSGVKEYKLSSDFMCYSPTVKRP